jgi:hypothetical protein
VHTAEMDHQNNRELVASVSALVVHASRKGEESKRTLYTSPVIAVAKGRGLFNAGWQVHIIDADGEVFHPEKFDKLLRFPAKSPIKF